MNRHVSEEAKLKKQISELEEKVATSMAEISSLKLQLLDKIGETAETTPIVYVPPATDQSDDVRSRRLKNHKLLPGARNKVASSRHDLGTYRIPNLDNRLTVRRMIG
ncbi:conserved hypothetical protein [Ricinus communis]|uniref:Uncharacterized protein n=1 Tax=Ricinus communis TaxID=3988 RepID=B9SBA9_RICCO|nr:conserved hypothetical protein [Ricinus communis]